MNPGVSGGEARPSFILPLLWMPLLVLLTVLVFAWLLAPRDSASFIYAVF